MRKTLLWLGSGLLSFILLSLLVLASVAFTEPGSRVLLNALGKMAPLEIEYAGGSLLGELQLAHLRLINDHIELELSDVRAELDGSCLWLGRICFLDIGAAELEIRILPSDDEASADKPNSLSEHALSDHHPAELLVFPYSVDINLLSIGNTYIHWQSGLWHHGQSNAQVNIKGSQIIVNGARAEDSYLELRNLAPKNLTARGGKASDKITLPTIDLPLELLVNELTIKRPSWNFYGHQHQNHALSLTGRWLNTRLQISQATINDQTWGGTSLSGNIEFIADWPIGADAELKLAQPPVWAGLHDRTLNLDLSGDLATLVFNTQLKGSEQINLTGKLNTLDKNLAFELQANARWPGSFPLRNLPGVTDQLPKQLRDINLLSPWQLSANGTLNSQSFSLVAAAQGLNYKALRLSLNGQHENTKVSLERVELHEIASGDPVEDNPVEDKIAEHRIAQDSSATLNGELLFGEQFQWALTTESSGFNLPAINENVSGRLRGKLQISGSTSKDNWLLALDNVDLQGDLNGLPAMITGYAKIKNGLYITQSKLFAELNGARLMLEADDGADRGLQFNLNIADLSRWQTDSAGTLALNANISADTQHIAFSGTGQDLQWHSIAINNTKIDGYLSLKNPHASAPLSLATLSLLQRPFALNISLDNIKVDSTQLHDLTIAAKSNAQGQSLSLSSRGLIEGKLELRGNPSVIDGNDRWNNWSGTLLPTQLTTPIGQWLLADPVGLNWDGTAQQFKIAPHCWQEHRAQLCTEAFSLGKEGGGHLDLDGDIGLLAELFPENIALQGQLIASLDSYWNATGGPYMKGELALQSGQITQSLGAHESATMSWDRADVQFTRNPADLQFMAGFIQAGNKAVSANLTLPLDNNGTLNGSLIFNQLPLYAFRPFVPKLSKLRGQLNGTILLSGSSEQPLGHGSVRVSSGQFAAVANPGEIKDMNLELKLQGDWAEFKGQGTIGGGDLNITGKVFSQPEPRMSLNLQGSKQAVLIPPGTQLLISENLNLSVSDKLLELDGKLIVHEGVVELEQLPEEGVALSPDVIEIDAQGKPLIHKHPFDTALDLRVAISDQLKVIGQGLNVLVGGDLHLLQKAQQPIQLFGDLNVLGGELQAYGQRLLVKRGNLSFVGAPENPALDVRAEREISNENVSVGVTVQGSLETPLLQTYSDPAMSQTEALSYLVRGRGLASGSGAQTGNDGTALALSLGTGLVNQSGLLTGFDEIPGVSNVELGTADSANETKATVSGYLGDRLYLSYGVGLYEPINVLTSRFYLRTRLWLEVVSSLENSLDLYYSFDID